MNKRYFVSLLLCLLALPMVSKAQAYVSIEDLNASPPERWQQTYETKWRTIEIDVQPTLPRVSTVPVFTVALDSWLPEVSSLGDGWQSELDEMCFIFNVKLNDIKDKGYNDHKAKFFYPPFYLDNKYSENSELTLGAVLQDLQSTMFKLGDSSDQWQFESPFELAILTSTDAKAKELNYPDMYRITLKQKLNGIPLLCHALDGIEKPKDQEIWPMTVDVTYVVSSPDVFMLCGSRVKELENLYDDVPLCAFSKVKQALESEIQAGHIRKIFSVDLGYCLFNEPGISRGSGYPNWATFYAVPVWRVNCYCVESGKKEMRDYAGLDVPVHGVIEYKTLIVNAQTGEVMNRSDNHKGCGDYQGFLSWEDVGGRE